MADQPDKPRPVEIKKPGHTMDRTNDLKIGKDAAQRIIARYLREKMTPDEANTLANRICEGIAAVAPTATRPGLRGWRMIDQYPPYEAKRRIAETFRAVRLNQDDNAVASAVWDVVFAQGIPVPDDVVV
jgi:hypothetical protein